MPAYLYMFTNLYIHIRPNLTYFYGHIRHIKVYILIGQYSYIYVFLRLHTYSRIHISTPTYTCLHNIRPYIQMCRHTSTSIYLYKFTFFYSHICPAHVYIFLRPCAPYTCFHISTPLYLDMFTKFYIHVSVHVCTLLRTYTYTRFHTSTPT
jgi:hypothetical protein